MDEEIINKEVAQKLMEIKGQIRGVSLTGDADFILKKENKEGLKKVESKLKELGFLIEYDKIKTLNFYPGGLKALSLLAIKDVFGYSDKEIEEIGRMSSKLSLIIRLFIKYFSSPSNFFFKEAPKIWKKYWTVGEFIPIEFNEKEKFAIVRVEGLNLHPIYCVFLRGFFPALTQLILGNESITCQETKCCFKGDNFHEFLLKWN